MFGTFRFILAAMVVIQHFGMVLGPIGALAVQAFFCLSGFLMTLLMSSTYKGRPGAFALNRFLRLYPTYWAVMAITAVLLIWGFPPSHSLIGIPEMPALVLDALYINHRLDTQLVLTGWAVTNEILFYILIGFGISKTFVRSAIWLIASAVFALGVMVFSPLDSELRYFSPLAASLPFSMGATAYHLHLFFPRHRRDQVIKIAVASMIAITIGVMIWRPTEFSALFLMTMYAFLAVTTALVVALYFVERSPMKKFDDQIGKLSYPLYLVHYTAGMLTLGLLGHAATFETLGIVVLLASILLSVGIVLLVDNPVEWLRARVRKRGKGRLPPSQLRNPSGALTTGERR